MVAGYGNKCIKYIFFAFNFLFFLLGAILVGLSLWARFDNDFQSRMETFFADSGTPVQVKELYLVLYLIMGLGALLCFTGFLGCCGAFIESVCMIGLFFIILLALFVAEIAGVVYVFVRKDGIKDEVADWYKTSFVDKYSEPRIKPLLDQIQRNFDCCGSRSCTDYGTSIPESCTCTTDTPGCSTKAFEMLSKHTVVVAAFLVAILVIELLAMVFSCILCSAIRTETVYYDY